jgi:hypothetical protein
MYRWVHCGRTRYLRVPVLLAAAGRAKRAERLGEDLEPAV